MLGDHRLQAVAPFDRRDVLGLQVGPHQQPHPAPVADQPGQSAGGESETGGRKVPGHAVQLGGPGQHWDVEILDGLVGGGVSDLQVQVAEPFPCPAGGEIGRSGSHPVVFPTIRI